MAKLLTLKMTDLPSSKSPEEKASYRELISLALNTPADPQRGMPVDEIRERIKILDKLDSCTGDVLELEDAEASKLNQCVQHMHWAALHKDILTFTDDVKTMPQKDKPIE